MNQKNTPLSMRIFEKKFDEVKGMFGIHGKKAYLSDDVDKFLTDVGEEAEELEKTTGTLYKFYRMYKDVVNKGKEDTLQSTSDIDTQAGQRLEQRANDERVAKMQAHMAELLESAEERAENRELEAKLKAKQIIDTATQQAQSIVQTAQIESNEIEKNTKEKMRELVQVKKEIETNAKKLKEDFEAKALEVRSMGSTFHKMSQEILSIVQDDQENKSA